MSGHQGKATRDDPYEAIPALTERTANKVRTSSTGTIVDYDHKTQLGTIQPNMSITRGDKTLRAPQLQKVRIIQPRGGGYTSAFPLKAGDPVTITFMSNNHDEQGSSGGDAAVTNGRSHDMSDAIAYPGGGDDTNPMQGLPPDGVHYGKDDGSAGMQVKESGQTSLVGGPSGSEKFTISPDGKIDMKSENGTSLFDILKELIEAYRDHKNEGKEMDAPDIAKANELLEKLNEMRA